jgi:hypothetical protein
MTNKAINSTKDFAEVLNRVKLRSYWGSWETSPHGSSHLPPTKREQRGYVDSRDFRMRVFVRRTLTPSVPCVVISA